METLGNRIQRLRKNNKLTQEEIAVRLNVTTQAVSKWENDISSPDISLLLDLALILGTTTDYLLGKEEALVKQVPEEKRDINKLVLKIIILSSDGDVVKVNLPVALVKLCLESNTKLPQIEGNSSLKNIDFKQIFALIEQGVIGELVSIVSSDGDNISIVVE